MFAPNDGPFVRFFPFFALFPDANIILNSVGPRPAASSLSARADLMAGFTAERDMGTEGAGSADTAVRDAIDQGLIPGPRLRISGNAIDILLNRIRPSGTTAISSLKPSTTSRMKARPL